jgi:hypothetical protein
MRPTIDSPLLFSGVLNDFIQTDIFGASGQKPPSVGAHGIIKSVVIAPTVVDCAAQQIDTHRKKPLPHCVESLSRGLALRFQLTRVPFSARKTVSSFLTLPTLYSCCR